MKNEDAKIIIGRKSSVWGCAVKYNVLLDNVLVGFLGNGGEVAVHTSPGAHTISLIRGNKKVEAVISFHIPDGQKETYFFVTLGVFNANIAPLQANVISTPAASKPIAVSTTDTPNKKLTVCKICGNQIAKNAKVCPNCGAKNSRTKQKILTVLGVLVVLSIIGSALPESEEPTQPTNASQSASAADQTAQPPTATPQQEAPKKEKPKKVKQEEPKEQAIAVSAKDLYDAYSANAVNADSLYLDKELMVTGTILDITQDALTNAPCVRLGVGDTLGIYSVDCFFPKNAEESSVIAGFTDGQVVTITGKCTGVALVNVQLSECHL